MNPIVIIGTGLAGYTLAREFRKLNKNTPLLLLTADDGGFYSKPMLSSAFAQGKGARQLVTHSAMQMAAQLGASIITGTRVDNIDTAGKTVEAGAGRFAYDKLVLALGARPNCIPLAGDASDEVMSVNHVDDYAHFRRSLEQKGQAAQIVILGAGLIGCEFADDLATAGHRVTLVDRNPRPLAALTAPALSQGLRRALAERGVMFELGTTATSVDHLDDKLKVSLQNGSMLEADIVLSAIGLRPDLRLAYAAGLQTARGMLVDGLGQTSAPDVYALGDCAEYTLDAHGNSGTLPYVAPLMTAARAIASTLSGRPAAIDIKPTPVVVKTPSFPLALLPPAANAHGAWCETQYGDRLVCRYYDAEGLLAGFGVAPQEASVRQGLMAELGKKALDAA